MSHRGNWSGNYIRGTMSIENKIISSGTIKLSDVLFNPKNWRVHPKYQKEELSKIVRRVGWVEPVIINKRTGNLVDGHLRCLIAETENETEIPCIYIDVSEEDEDLLLATLDPITALVNADKEKLDELLKGFKNDTFSDLMNSIAYEYKIDNEEIAETGRILDVMNFELALPKNKVSRGDIISLGKHTLICASVVDDVPLWLPHLTPQHKFAPYPTPMTLLSQLAEKFMVLAVNPDEFICGHIVDRWYEAHT